MSHSSVPNTVNADSDFGLLLLITIMMLLQSQSYTEVTQRNEHIALLTLAGDRHRGQHSGLKNCVCCRKPVPSLPSHGAEGGFLLPRLQICSLHSFLIYSGSFEDTILMVIAD